MTEHENLPRWRREGPPYQMTYEELFDELKDAGVDMTKATLRRWTANGLLPKLTPELPPGATDGKPRLLHPLWFYSLVRDIFWALRQGRSIADLQREAPERIARYQEASRTVPERQGCRSFAEVEREFPGMPARPVTLRRLAWEYGERVRAHLEKAEGEPVQIGLTFFVETATKGRFTTDFPIEPPVGAKKRRAKPRPDP